ncbi:hypothetical protein HI914_05836 [Erysiphe necator]|nr:hypothetical protein HI914_05836 [Erysiphe necator]
MKLFSFLAALALFTTSLCAIIPKKMGKTLDDDTAARLFQLEARDPRKGRQNCGFVGQSCPGG